MSTTFALTSASALEAPVIVIDTFMVDEISYFSSPSSASSSSSSELESSPSPSSTNFLHIPVFMNNSPSTTNLRVNRRNPTPMSPFTPVNSPASPDVREHYLVVPVGPARSPSVRSVGLSPTWSSCNSSTEEDKIFHGSKTTNETMGNQLISKSPKTPPNTPCSPSSYPSSSLKTPVSALSNSASSDSFVQPAEALKLEEERISAMPMECSSIQNQKEHYRLSAPHIVLPLS